MKTVTYEYRIEEMTDADDSILLQCLLAAIKRVRGYLSARYDTDAIFTAKGADRDADIVEICKHVALWFLVQRSNVDVMFDHVREMYDRDIVYLTAVSRAEIAADLPLRKDENGDTTVAPRMGSNPKFSHHF